MGSISQSQYAEMLARLNRGTSAPRNPKAVEREADLHEQIVDRCRERNWIALHGAMHKATARSLGEADFTILADGGRVFFIEAKSKTGKLRQEQAALAAWAKMLGHTIHVVRCIEEFDQITKQP